METRHTATEVHFLTERELAAKLRCSVPGIRAWRRQGLPARRLGKLVRYELPKVLAWFERQQRQRDAAPSGRPE